MGTIITEAKKKGEEVNKKKLISMLIVEYGVSKKTALEEIDAVMDYNSKWELNVNAEWESRLIQKVKEKIAGSVESLLK